MHVLYFLCNYEGRFPDVFQIWAWIHVTFRRITTIYRLTDLDLLQDMWAYHRLPNHAPPRCPLHPCGPATWFQTQTFIETQLIITTHDFAEILNRKSQADIADWRRHLTKCLTTGSFANYATTTSTATSSAGSHCSSQKNTESSSGRLRILSGPSTVMSPTRHRPVSPVIFNLHQRHIGPPVFNHQTIRRWLPGLTRDQIYHRLWCSLRGPEQTRRVEPHLVHGV